MISSRETSSSDSLREWKFKCLANRLSVDDVRRNKISLQLNLSLDEDESNFKMPIDS